MRSSGLPASALLAALLAALLLPACGNSGRDPASATTAVVAISPVLSTATETPFTIEGKDFLSLLGSDVTVRFTAVSGTPFAGSKDFADVPGVVVSNTEIQGTAPTATSATPFEAWVSVHLPGGHDVVSAGPIATFAPPSPKVLRDDPTLVQPPRTR
jgi:hypothetical protein